MELQLFTVYDRKTKVHLPPVAYLNADAAKREFRIIAEKQPLSPMVMFPSDFDLMHVGTFTDHDGNIRCFQPELECNMSDLVRKAVDRPLQEDVTSGPNIPPLQDRG